MIDATPSPWLVPFGKPFAAARARTRPQGKRDEERLERRLAEILEELAHEQRRLMASNSHALLVVLQGMDACGKDGTIRAISKGLDAAGCRVTTFKAPSAEELDHDFLWRVNRALPERGTIGIFNRSHYEEVLVVRVEPRFLAGQRIPGAKPGKELWEGRYESIRELEQHLARNGTVIRKFWLNVSRDEQKKRFLERMDEPHSRWKFSAADVDKRTRWRDYMKAYSAALEATSRPWAPWYAVPSDDKDALRLIVAEILVATLKSMKLQWPKTSADDLAAMARARRQLAADE